MTTDILIFLFTLKKTIQFFTINYNFKFFGKLLYEVEEDEENNPIVMYIEDDIEYAIAAQYFSSQLDEK